MTSHTDEVLLQLNYLLLREGIFVYSHVHQLPIDLAYVVTGNEPMLRPVFVIIEH